MNTSSLNHNLELARALVADLIEFHYEIEPDICDLLADGDEYELHPLPGDNMEEITGRLKQALSLASESVPMPSKGRNKEVRKYRQECARERIRLIASTCIAFLEIPTKN